VVINVIILIAIGAYSINGYLWLFHYKPLVAIDGYYMLYYDYWRLFYYKLLFDILCYNIISYW
jgi:hypothetical protein